MWKCKEEREIKERFMRLSEMNDENEEKLEVLRKQLNELRGLYKKGVEHYIGKHVRYGGICMKVDDVCVKFLTFPFFPRIFSYSHVHGRTFFCRTISSIARKN